MLNSKNNVSEFQCKFSEIEVIGAAYGLVKTSLAVIDENLNIKYANSYFRHAFTWGDTDYVDQPFKYMCQNLNIPNFIDPDTLTVSPRLLNISYYTKELKLTPVKIDDEEHYFLTDDDKTELEDFYSFLSQKLEKITGQKVKKKPLSWYIDEIHYYLESTLLQMPGYVYLKDKNYKYLFCNDSIANSLGFKSINDVIGKTDYDFGWDKAVVDEYRKIDEEIIRTGEPQIDIEEAVVTKDGKNLHLLVNKRPMRNNEGEIIGIIGINIDISDRKEAEFLKIAAEEHAKFKSVVGQVAHDIRSPLANLTMVLKTCDTLPETQRTALRRSITRISDIANNLLNRFKPNTVLGNMETVHQSPLLLSTALLEIISEKKNEYQNLNVEFQFSCNQNEYFAFINTETSAFNRMISNIINNAVDAFEGKPDGKIIIHLRSEDQTNSIVIEDNGKGMPKAVIDKILHKIKVTEGKQDGHGLGLTQVRETLEASQGKLLIDSTLGTGTKITLKFPKREPANWIVNHIVFNSDDHVIILDDDPSIHEAWKLRFETENLKVPVKHFDNGDNAINFINSLKDDEKQKVFFLVDYELINQGTNGLIIIEKAGVKRAILVTSYYSDKEITHRAMLNNVKILPKLLVPEVPINVNSNATDEIGITRQVDLVILDDDKDLVDNLMNFVLGGKVVDKYYTPQSLFESLSRYPKETKILIDNYFPDNDVNGQEIAKQLYNDGFTNLYLYSGTEFRTNALPFYLKSILKTDIDKIKSLVS